MVRKRLCACGCGDEVTKKVELQHMNVLAPTVLASQVLDQNQTVIRRKKRFYAVGFPAPVRQRLRNNNPFDEAVLPDRNSPIEDFPMDHAHAGPSALSDDDDIYMDDIYLDDPASPHHMHDDSASPHHTLDDPASPHDIDTHDNPASPHDTHDDPESHDMHDDPHVDDDEVYGLSNLRRSRRIAGNVEQISQRRWGSDVPVDFVNNRESDEEEDLEEDIEDDGDFDVDVSDGLEGYEEDDDELFAGPGQEGISLWDSLGDGFLREVSQLGMS
jgi:hypothetical protein